MVLDKSPMVSPTECLGMLAVMAASEIQATEEWGTKLWPSDFKERPGPTSYLA